MLLEMAVSIYLQHTQMICFFIFFMMLLIDLIDMAR